MQCAGLALLDSSFFSRVPILRRCDAFVANFTAAEFQGFRTLLKFNDPVNKKKMPEIRITALSSIRLRFDHGAAATGPRRRAEGRRVQLRRDSLY
ncbi:hypothetical protein EVAR_82362_1 [Eumeta japonica]|uniref:Uncharacterized protein n=1 Tax=Eumeta variegata TaxID=151549 RepID=A0A4C1UAU1_EUMVA|nr:hypothetical protein EVAR_82362_1 [Eumeta japonica]